MVVIQFQSSQIAADSNVAASNKIDEKIGDPKYSSHSLDEVSGMMRSTISLYEIKVTFSVPSYFGIILLVYKPLLDM